MGSGSSNLQSLSRGAAAPSCPKKVITSMLALLRTGFGLGISATLIRLRFLSSFSAQVATIFLGLLLPYPFLNLNSPLTYRSRSLKINIDVLKIFTANSSPVAFFHTMINVSFFTCRYTTVDFRHEFIAYKLVEIIHGTRI